MRQSRSSRKYLKRTGRSSRRRSERKSFQRATLYLITVRYTLSEFNSNLSHNFYLTVNRKIEDEGDKLYIMISGEIRIDIPDPDIDPAVFKQRYDEYQLLIKDIAARKELERKKELVEKRKNQIEEF